MARQEDTDITLAPVSEALPALTRRAPASGWFHVGICARRRSRRPRGGAGRIRLADVALGGMVFGDPVAAFAHMRSAASTRTRFACLLAAGHENPRLKVPMDAVSRHLPPRP